MNDVVVDEWQGPILGDPAGVWREKKGCNSLTCCNDEGHSEFAGAVINAGNKHNEMTAPGQTHFQF